MGFVNGRNLTERRARRSRPTSEGRTRKRKKNDFIGLLAEFFEEVEVGAGLAGGFEGLAGEEDGGGAGAGAEVGVFQSKKAPPSATRPPPIRFPPKVQDRYGSSEGSASIRASRSKYSPVGKRGAVGVGP